MTYELLHTMCRDKTFPISGKNTDGEDIFIKKGEDSYTVCTLQQNGWICEVTYHKDGTVEEEYTK